MPPKKTTTRLDITLPIALVDRVKSHADSEGMTVSSLIGDALKAYLDGGISPSSGPGMLSPETDVTIKRMLEEITIEYLKSDLIDARIERFVSRYIATHPPDRDVVPSIVTEPEETTPETSLEAWISEPAQEVKKERPSKAKMEYVDISDAFRDRMKDIPGIKIEKATGIHKSDVSKIKSGKKTRVTKETLDKLVAALIAFEAESEHTENN